MYVAGIVLFLMLFYLSFGEELVTYIQVLCVLFVCYTIFQGC